MERVHEVQSAARLAGNIRFCVMTITVAVLPFGPGERSSPL